MPWLRVVARPQANTAQQYLSLEEQLPLKMTVATESGIWLSELCEDQAIWLLRNIVNEANSADTIRVEAPIVSNAVDLLWNRDQIYARDNIQRTFSILLKEYEAKLAASPQDATALHQISDGISVLIKGLARRDSSLALSMLKQYQTARAKALGDTSSTQSSKACQISRKN